MALPTSATKQHGECSTGKSYEETTINGGHAVLGDILKTFTIHGGLHLYLQPLRRSLTEPLNEDAKAESRKSLTYLQECLGELQEAARNQATGGESGYSHELKENIMKALMEVDTLLACAIVSEAKLEGKTPDSAKTDSELKSDKDVLELYETASNRLSWIEGCVSSSRTSAATADSPLLLPLKPFSELKPGNKDSIITNGTIDSEDGGAEVVTNSSAKPPTNTILQFAGPPNAHNLAEIYAHPSYYRIRLQSAFTAMMDEDFKDEKSAIELWFDVLSEDEQTCMLYHLLKRSSSVQKAFCAAAASNMNHHPSREKTLCSKLLLEVKEKQWKPSAQPS